MVPVSPEVAMFAAPLLIGGLVWLVRLEGRVNNHDDRHKQHDKEHQEIRNHLEYIRERIDSMADRKER